MDLRVLSAAVAALFPVLALAQAPVGIPRELAVERAANVSGVHYALRYTLAPHASALPAEEELRFELKRTQAPLLVDFRDGNVQALKVNGNAVTPVVSNGHIVLDGKTLRVGGNVVEIRFTANAAAAEKAITRFEDRDDGSEYFYTLFVPMDASMAFPCFDQPDLKGEFQLTLTAPAEWTAISNTDAVEKKPAEDGQTQTTFAETRPISTYLFAFAAGPFVKVHEAAGLPGVYVRKSKAKAAESEAPAVQKTAADGIRYLSEYFAQPFPFPKYDMVLIPGFAYGGMEHAGATFLREEGVLFRTAPTATTVLNRDVLVLHELAHQWFGDFTTMKWFDDLWLKEGFAQYMAYKSLAELRPNEPIWKRFYEAIKPAAYAIDQTQGTTPIYQDIPNLKDAKSAYGAIVYSKAPGVLKQLNFVLGEEAFRGGLRAYLAAHAYGNATWSDLIEAFEKASGKSLKDWAEMWIHHRGMPRVDVAWSCAGGTVSSLKLTQRDELGTDTLWPIAVETVMGFADGKSEVVPVQFAGRSLEVNGAKGKTCPAFVFANAEDYGYGLFMLDEKSREYLTQHIGLVSDLFERTLVWGSLWQDVREADFAPREYVELALRTLPAERDEALAASMIGRSEAAAHRYMSDGDRKEFSARLETMAEKNMKENAEKDLRIMWFRALSGVSDGPAGRDALKALLTGTAEVPGVQLRAQDRWGMVTALIAYGDVQADAVLASEDKRDPSGDGKKFSYIAQAARPDAANKQRYFDDYLHHAEIPEDWISGSLGAFNFWNQSELTQPYLDKALAALDQIKQKRTIFFLGGWLGAFIGGQESEASRQGVYAYLESHEVDKDLRLKILESVDELDRTVAIRKKYAAH